MNREDLYRAIGGAEDAQLENSERARFQKRGGRHWWMSAAAAVLVLAIAGGVLLRPGGQVVAQAGMIAKPEYPQMAPYPVTENEYDTEKYEAWKASLEAQQAPEGYADGLDSFFAASIPQFLAGEEGENRVCSPLNVYMALSMLAELTDGSSRDQILHLLGSDSIDALRTQASAVWNAHYRSDGAVTSVLANSVWLDEDVDYQPETMQRLADIYYASAYRGQMGSREMDEALQDWLNEQTGGLLEEQAEQIHLDPQTVLALASTLYYQEKWQARFDESATTSGVFHALQKDITCNFMHSDQNSQYYWGERFSATALAMSTSGTAMWLILPNEGVSVPQLLADAEVMDFLTADGNYWNKDWDKSRQALIHLSMPRFDVSSQMDLADDLQALGVTDVFDPAAADFSPAIPQEDGVYLSKVEHDVRVKVDEQGVTAAAYTVEMLCGSGLPPEEVDFVLDRPFLFALTSQDGLPLFVGSVYQPGA